MLWCSDCERAWKWIFTLRGVSLLKSILIFTLWSALSTFGEKLDYTRPLKIVIWKYIFEKPSTSWSLHCSAQCSVKPEYNSILCFKQCLIKIHPLHIAQLHIAASLCTQYLITVASQCTGLCLYHSALVQQQVFGWFSKLWLPTRWPLRSFPQMVILITINTRLRRNFLGILFWDKIYTGVG